MGSVLSEKSVITYLNNGEGLDRIERTALASRLGAYTREKGACSSCYALLIQALVVLEKDANLPEEPVLIGRGYKGQTIIGNSREARLSVTFTPYL